MALCTHEDVIDPCTGVHLPAWSLITSLHGATIQDPNSLDAGGSGLAGDGTWTMDRNTTRGAAFDAIGAGIYAAIPISSLEPDWDPATERLAFRVDIETHFADDGNGIALALTNAALSAGGGFLSFVDGPSLSFAEQPTSGASNVVALDHTALYFDAFIREVGGSQRMYQRMLVKDGSGEWTPGDSAGNIAPGTTDLYLVVQATNDNTGTAVAEAATFKVYTKRILQGAIIP